MCLVERNKFGLNELLDASATPLEEQGEIPAIATLWQEQNHPGPYAFEVDLMRSPLRLKESRSRQSLE